jgi:hypothetical protein
MIVRENPLKYSKTLYTHTTSNLLFIYNQLIRSERFNWYSIVTYITTNSSSTSSVWFEDRLRATSSRIEDEPRVLYPEHKADRLGPPSVKVKNVLIPLHAFISWCSDIGEIRLSINVSVAIKFYSQATKQWFYSSAHPRRSRGLRSWKPARTVKPRCAKLSPCGKSGVRGTTDSRNKILNTYN